MLHEHERGRDCSSGDIDDNEHTSCFRDRAWATPSPDTAFVAILQDVHDAGKTVDVTAGYLRAGLRRLDEVEQAGLSNAFLPDIRSGADRRDTASRLF